MKILTNKFDLFGLDIGDRSLKLAYLEPIGKKAILKSASSIDVPKGVFDKGALIKPEVFCENLTKLIAKSAPKKISTKYVHACLPETHTFIKLLSIETGTREEISALIREELPRHVPLDINESYIDWNIAPSAKPNPGQVQVLVGAIPKKTSDAYTNSLKHCGLVPVSLQIEAQAILRCLLPFEPKAENPFVIIDIGATRSSFIYYDYGTIQFTVSAPFSSEDITDIISSQLSLSKEDAEKAKISIGLDPKKGQASLIKILDPMIKELAQSIQKNNSFYLEHFPGARPITSLMLCGGGSLLSGLPELLEKEIPNIKISLGNQMQHIQENKDISLNLAYTTAIGLGLTNVFDS
ncbi:hypothetical protein CL632_00885 [bacterium]|jgi:type IV pilus assembly protein PilM|nr:hypothetical protein [bacterium]MDP6571654.1 type IV pilus assembly protein PilM [Patescibacteria group bacterium]MDP6756307.1 type IV pilus assembly protein PilM [Patescibacteria group bacterium]|tara:strand:+ start:65305 stop:66360 length:1056 start_codon:yes stop_codon:yes gene_type:complete